MRKAREESGCRLETAEVRGAGEIGNEDGGVGEVTQIQARTAHKPEKAVG